MERIGIGNTAEVFAYKKDKVCKLFYKGYPLDSVKREFNNSRLVNSLNIPSPKADELIEQEGRYGIIYERLYGESMLTLLLTKPDNTELIEKMVEIQKQMLEIHSDKCMNYKDFLRGLLFGKQVDNHVYQLIEMLPDGDCVCHGDYHPGNVWVNEQGSYKVIDFMNVCHGPKEYDIARTYVLITQDEFPAGISEEQKENLRQLRCLLGKEYLKLMQVTVEQIQQYIEVITICRKYES